MNLRPHHLLCLPNFIGEGYGDAFCANMAAKKALLEREDRFTPVCGCDGVCAACPHRQGDRCDAEEKVTRYDNAVRELLDLSPGVPCSYRELTDRVKREIFAPGRLREICGDCQWADLCERIIGEKR